MSKNVRRFCPKCGHPVRRDEQECPNCGYDLQQYFHTYLPAVKKQRQNGWLRVCSWFGKHKIGCLTGILVVLFFLVGGYMANHRDEIGTTPAQRVARQLPRYSWVVTAKKDAGGMNDTLLFLFNGRKLTINPAMPPILKICDELSSNREARDKINLGVQKSTAHYRVAGDSFKINGHKSIKNLKKTGHHYEFMIKTRSGQKMKMIMTKYKKISPRLRN